MLRLELEIGMVDGTIAVKDLPEIWNTKMEEYLGIVPLNDAKGVLQDSHWSGGMIGYFYLCTRKPDLGPNVGKDPQGHPQPG